MEQLDERRILDGLPADTRARLDSFAVLDEVTRGDVIAQVGRDEVLEEVFVDVLLPLHWPRMPVVLDVQPAKAFLHSQVLLKYLISREALAYNVGGVKDEHHRRVIHLSVNLFE